MSSVFFKKDELTEKKVMKKIPFAGTCSASDEFTARANVISRTCLCIESGLNMYCR
jgi:hypothetical protein